MNAKNYLYLGRLRLRYLLRQAQAVGDRRGAAFWATVLKLANDTP